MKKAATRGFSFGAPTLGEIELAEMIVQAIPSIEMVRLVNSGTEATMSAVRLARGFTGRPKIVNSSAQSHDEDLQSRLWTVSEELTGVSFGV